MLLIEKEERPIGVLSSTLRKNGYVIDTAVDGEIGAKLAITGVYDIIIMDCISPLQDGLSILKGLRSYGLETPVLFLVAQNDSKEGIKALDCGADDYLNKPFLTEELLARLRALARRKDREWIDNKISAAGMLLDPLRCEVIKEKEVIHLTVRESQVLELLMYNCGHVVTKERILEKVWGYNSDLDIANVDLYVHYLRKKLETSNIKTARGVGYYLFDDEKPKNMAPVKV